jgi:CheY-like chemotaxis protein
MEVNTNRKRHWGILSLKISSYNHNINSLAQGKIHAKYRTYMGHVPEINDAEPNMSFIQSLRQALRHFYDPDRLSKNPLCLLFDLGASPSSALQDLLIEAIEALQPEAGVSRQSNTWRTYHILYHRYVEQFTQSEVAHNLGLSIRQLRRQEQLALRTLSDYLRIHYNLLLPDALTDALDEDAEDEEAMVPVSAKQELTWLERSISRESVKLSHMMAAALLTINPLITEYGVTVNCDIPESLPNLAIHRVTFQQALLNLLTAMVHMVPGGVIGMSAKPEAQQIQVIIQTQPAQRVNGLPEPQPGQQEKLEVTRQLLELSNGSVSIQECTPLSVALLLPSAEELTVLVIDDNADTLKLFQGCLVGTRYPYQGIQDPQKALEAVQNLKPRFIILDVMLPGVDGWELLGRLREHPHTRHSLIIICTILPQEQLALTLGATAFLRKPFTRAELLALLDRLAGQPVTTSY